MPLPRSCTYSNCKQDLLAHDVNLKLNKTQQNHIQTYHRDTPVNDVCPYTKKIHTFRRIPDKDIDYVCLCRSTFTQNNNFVRHLKSCKVVNAAAGSQLAATSKNNLTSVAASQNSTIDVIRITPSHGELAQNTNPKGLQAPSLRRLRSHNSSHPYRREGSVQESASNHDRASDLCANDVFTENEQFRQLVSVSTTEQKRTIAEITTQQLNILEALKTTTERHQQMATWMADATSSQQEMNKWVQEAVASQ
ncbi:MAG: hypothetical protein BYD32DRAFT_460155 [Podila humilis]|nr:MAG: hypothetical protein BYD32DRAFT_460155 [Podila humilis]